MEDEDLLALRRRLNRTFRSVGRGPRAAVAVLAGGAALVGGPAFGLGIAVGCFVFGVLQRVLVRRQITFVRAAYEGSFALGSGGLGIRRPGTDLRFEWPAIQSVVNDGVRLMFQTTRATIYVIPLRCASDPEQLLSVVGRHVAVASG